MGCEWANIRNDDGRYSLTEFELEYATVCFTGENIEPIPGCWDFDRDRDNDVDYSDYIIFLGCYNAAQHPDQECNSPDGVNEIGTPGEYFQCGDGVDNDNDGTIDYPQEASCVSTQDTTENWPYQCQDAIDNDGDGLVDYPDDSNCTDRGDDSEI